MQNYLEIKIEELKEHLEVTKRVNAPGEYYYICGQIDFAKEILSELPIEKIGWKSSKDE